MRSLSAAACTLLCTYATPGPAQYTLPSTLDPRATNFAAAAARNDDMVDAANRDAPGPGQYNITVPERAMLGYIP